MNNNLAWITGKHLAWILGLIIIVILICITCVYLQNHAWIIRFEMDNNTLEAVKSVNWSALPK